MRNRAVKNQRLSIKLHYQVEAGETRTAGSLGLCLNFFLPDQVHSEETKTRKQIQKEGCILGYWVSRELSNGYGEQVVEERMDLEVIDLQLNV